MKIIPIGIFIIIILSGFSSLIVYPENLFADHFNESKTEYFESIEFPKMTNGNLIKSRDEDYILEKFLSNAEKDTPIIVIEDISAYFNSIVIIIKNTGDGDVSNISINVNISGGIFVIATKNYEISKIPSGDKFSQKIFISGLGMGVFTKFIKVTFEITSLDTPTTTGRTTLRIFGTFIKIISNSYNIDNLCEGYTLFAPMWDTKTYLIKNNGDIVHSWKSIHLETQAAYLLENGNLIRTSIVPFFSKFSGGSQGFIEMFDWDGNRVWKYKYVSDNYCQHHDVEVLPSGNILLIAWEVKSAEQAIAAGKDPKNLYGNQLWTDHIIEIEPVGDSGANIVWEWHAWDHLIQDFDSSKDNYGNISDHPELININYGRDWRDWLHVNSIDYNEKFNQILISVFNFNEIWVIDHSTTTEEASGHTGGNSGKGGDILYRWGNPQAYDHGNESNQKYFGQHGASWVEEGCPGEGNFIVFNNGGKRPLGRYSSVDEIIPPVDEYGKYYYTPKIAYGPEEQTWIYTAEDSEDMFSNICSNAQRLSNGNTLICSATQGTILEVTPGKDIVWSYHNIYPYWYMIKTVPEAIRYSVDYPGLDYLI